MLKEQLKRVILLLNVDYFLDTQHFWALSLSLGTSLSPSIFRAGIAFGVCRPLAPRGGRQSALAGGVS